MTDIIAALITHETDKHAGHLYYVKVTGRAPPPYTTQRCVQAILDIAADGTLAGIELIDNMPKPPVKERRKSTAPCSDPQH